MNRICLIPLRGGFGNQLFCWALGRQLEHSGHRVFFDRGVELGRGFALQGLIPEKQLFSLPPKIWRLLSSSSRFISALPGVAVNVENGNRAPDSHMATGLVTAYWGYWQSLDYFGEASEIVRSELTRWLDSAEASDSPYCAIHVRRGDYVTDVGAANVLGAQNREYYEEAISYMKDKGHSKFVIYTDDRAWAEQNLQSSDVLMAPEGEALDDFLGLARASALIMSNSSYSWWAAFHIDSRSGTIVRPSRWFRSKELDDSHITPTHWHQI